MAELITGGNHAALQVTVKLRQGIVQDPHQGVAFDGLLVSLLRDRGIHAGSFAAGSLFDGGTLLNVPVDHQLPLAQCVTKGGDWHWAATFAYPTTSLLSEQVFHTRNSVKHSVVERAVNKMPSTLSHTSGRFKNKRVPTPLTVVDSLTWRAVGDAAVIVELLDDVTHVGGRRHAGEGEVVSWVVETVDDDDWDSFAHNITGNVLGRHCFLECVGDRVGLVSGAVTVAGVRPPYWHSSRQRELVACATMEQYLQTIR